MQLHEERNANLNNNRLEQGQAATPGQAWADLPTAAQSRYLQEAQIAVDVMRTDGGSLSLNDPRQRDYAVGRITRARIEARLEQEPEEPASARHASNLALHHAELAQRILRAQRETPFGQYVGGPRQPWEFYDSATELTIHRQPEGAPPPIRLVAASFTRNGENKHVEGVATPGEAIVVPVLRGGSEPQAVLFKQTVPAFGNRTPVVSALSASHARGVDGRVAAFQALQPVRIPGIRNRMPVAVGTVAPQKYLTAEVSCYGLPLPESNATFIESVASAGLDPSVFKVYSEEELLDAIAEGEIPDLRAAAAALLALGRAKGRYQPDPLFQPDPAIEAMLAPLEVDTELLEPGAESEWFPVFETPDGVPLVHFPDDQAGALVVEYDAAGRPVAIHCCVEPFPLQGRMNLGFASGSVEEKSGYSDPKTAISEAKEEIGATGQVEESPLVSGNPFPGSIVMKSSVYAVHFASSGKAEGGDESDAERTSRARIPFAELEQYIAHGYFKDETAVVALMVLLARYSDRSQPKI